MRITLQRAEDSLETVSQLLLAYREQTGLSTQWDVFKPLPYAFYLLAFDPENEKPVGIAEFFFLDQAFDCYNDCQYPYAMHLSRLAPISQVVHVRTLICNEQDSRDDVIDRLGKSMIDIARALGARYLAANAATDLASLAVQTHANEVSISSNKDSADSQWSLVSLDWAARRSTSRPCSTTADDLLLARTIRRRGRRERNANTVNRRLDKLLPAHWVGVWQRQSRAFAW